MPFPRRSAVCPSAEIVRRAPNDFFLTVTRTGTRDSCPSGSVAPAATAGSAHTHPFRSCEGDRVDSVVQVFSEGDFNHAEFAPAKPTYMAAPYGHVLRYDPGGSLCKGSSWIARNYTIARDAPRSVRGKLMIASGEFQPMFGPNGQRTIERPSYCRDAPR